MNLTDARRAERDLTHALSTGDHQAVAEAITANIWPLYSTHFELLQMAIAALPHTAIEQSPFLQIIHPLTPVLSRTGRFAPPALHPDRLQALNPAEVDAVLLVYMIAYRLNGDESSALAYAERLVARITNVHIDSRDRIDGPLWFFHQQVGSTFLSAGDTSRSLPEFSTAGQLVRLSAQPTAERSTLGRTALAHALRGSLNEAERALCEASRRPSPSPQHANSTSATEGVADALISIARMTDDLDDKLAALEPYDSIEMTWPFALLARARTLLARNQPDDALETVRLTSQTHSVQPGSFASDVITSATIEALTMAADAAGAQDVLAEATTSQRKLTRAASVRLRLYQGDFESATREIRTIAADPTLGPARRAEYSLFSAWLEYARAGDLDEHTALQVARLGMKGDNRRLFALVPNSLLTRVSERVSPMDAESFKESIYGLVHIDVPSRPILTSGELRVLEALTVHDTNGAIAKAFDVSPNTIKSQLHSLYRKLECSSREEAVRIAMGLNLLKSNA